MFTTEESSQAGLSNSGSSDCICDVHHPPSHVLYWCVKHLEAQWEFTQCQTQAKRYDWTEERQRYPRLPEQWHEEDLSRCRLLILWLQHPSRVSHGCGA